MRRVRSLSLALALAAAAFVAAPWHHRAWGAPLGQGMSGMSRGAMAMSGRNAAHRSDAAAAALGIAGAQHITVYVLPGGNGLGFTGPDKTHHDTLVPSSFVLRKGIPVTFTVINLDDMRHSITAPQLGIDVIIKPGIDRKDGGVAPTTTTYTFIPAKTGEFRWFCVFPCDMPSHWAMSASYDGPDRNGFMAGIIRVL
jgi:heme/copper-type cytochrome/quinol oxidase subunit 2